MDNKVKTVIALNTAIVILQRLKYACEHDADFPMQVDLKELKEAKFQLEKAEELLKQA